MDNKFSTNLTKTNFMVIGKNNKCIIPQINSDSEIEIKTVHNV